MKKIASVLFLLASIIASAQFSKTHYIPPLSNADAMPIASQFMYISTPSLTPINFQLKEIGGDIINATVSRDAPFVYDLNSGTPDQMFVDQSSINWVQTNKGFIVEAEDVVYVTVRVDTVDGFQAGELVSKGLAALGTGFRIGGFLNTLTPGYSDRHFTFISILATENNTTVDFSDFPSGMSLINSNDGNMPASVLLNSGESYVIAVQGPDPDNKDALIGSLVTSDKPIVVNCGSVGGSNGELGNIDLGFDQIVSGERTGSDYIFIKSTGMDNVERVLLIADGNDTEIYLKGSTTPSYTLQAGEYVALTGADYSPVGNLYVHCQDAFDPTIEKKVFAYQSVGDNAFAGQANQEMFFVPPLSCQTPKSIDNIPYIEDLGGRVFTGRVTITTKTAATLSFIINTIPYTLASLAATGVSVNGPTPVVGNPNYECYTLIGLTGNVSVFSSAQLYLAAYGSNGAATFGGYYSGFTFKPEVTFKPINISQSNCIPNVQLKVSSLSGFDTFQWYLNNNPIPTATSNSITPTQPGYYHVSATLLECALTIPSNDIPVSLCAADMDNDGVNDNVDLDNDNDGLTNCTESLGNQYFNLTNTASGTISAGSYTNSYTGSTSFVGTQSTTPLTGDANGNFVTVVPFGDTNEFSYTVSNFTKPLNLSVEYASTALPTDLFTSGTEIRISCPVNNTLTILNPDNQLLIDTNYDGIYESGVTEFSSFEIRFRLNSTIPLDAGTGTFAIRGNQISSIKITNKNLIYSDSRVALRLIATCIPKDSDGDGVPDQLDYDSDNDSILDLIESQGQIVSALTHVDVNGDGIDDVFGSGVNADDDNDTIPNYLDLDSDNDGIHDIDESGYNIPDTNNNGIVDGTNFGTNGILNSLETTPDSGILKPIYVLADTDGDGAYNYVELDSDNDLCNDVIEAGYLDSNLDGYLGGTTPPTIDGNGIVTSGTGYGNANANYITAAPIVINTQPTSTTACELQNVVFTANTNTVTAYQWQISTDGGTTWTIITNNATYSGVNTNSLTITSVSPAMAGNKYRLYLIKTGNTCGKYSDVVNLTTYPLPVVTTPITLKQCDNDTDGITDFNLTQKNDVISANYLNETFTYYKNLAAATIENSLFEITNPIAYNSGNGTVYARVENANGCYRVARIDLAVSVTQIPPGYQVPNQFRFRCDDYLDAINDDRDGITKFDFTPITNQLLALLPPNISIKYYKSEADFLAETDASGNSLAIPDPTNYRNIGSPNTQKIWIRADSTTDNSCFGFKTFDIVVEALPFAYPINATNIIRHCDDNQDVVFGFDTSNIQSTVLNSQTGVNVKYYRANGTQLSTPLPNPFSVNTTETITIRVFNNATQSGGTACYDEETLKFIVDDLPEAFAINNTNLTSICDDELNPVDQDGMYDFNTSTFLATILGGQTGMNVRYYDQNNVLIPSPTPNQLPNPFRTATQNVTVIVENPINTNCADSVVIPFIVYPTPKIDIKEDIIICLPETDALIDAGILDGSAPSNYNFQWYDSNGAMSGQNGPSIIVDTPGVYSVEVTNTFGCPMTRVISVTRSQIASIQSIDVVDLADINSILVNVTGQGLYEFAIDDINGPYQDSNLFNNVPMGIHEIYVRDKYGCGFVGPIKVPILGIPHYFTPNADGYNDYWNVKGVSAEFNHISRILIFDRFGKLLKQIGTTGLGWDGTFNGHPMPADDYWYNIEFEDGRNAKGHFSLKR